MGDAIGAVGTPPRRFEHGEVIVRQGQPLACVHLVASGAVRLAAVTSSGREVVVALLGPGDLFGEIALLGGGPSPVEARAAGAASVVALPVGSLRAVIERTPDTAEELLRMIAARLHRTAGALEEALAHDVPARVSLRLRALARSHGASGAEGVRLPPRLTQEELARMVGASRESVNRSLTTLAAKGLLRVRDRRYVLPDPEALAVVAADR